MIIAHAEALGVRPPLQRSFRLTPLPYAELHISYLLFNCLVPEGPHENSPTLQRWGTGVVGVKSRRDA
jgi:hypothetical protein